MKYLPSLILAFTLGLTGCSVLPKPGLLSEKEVIETERSVVDGKTTVTELIALYGDKHTLDKTAQGKNILNWQQSWSSGFTANTTVLSVLAEDNIVIRHAVLRYKSNLDVSFLKNLTDSELASFILPGKTTRKDVENKYGKPNSNSFDDDGDPVMVYIYADASRSQYGWIPNVGGIVEALAGTAGAKVTMLQIPLDSHGVVKSYKLEKSNYHQGVGLLNSSELKRN